MLTAAQLQITPAEHEALATLRDALANNLLPEDFRFDMASTATRQHCGTVGCIGGAVGIMKQVGSQHDVQALSDPYDRDVRAADVYVFSREEHPTLDALYWPDPIPGHVPHIPYSIYTQADAARAIDNFLQTGDPDWKTAAKDTLAAYFNSHPEPEPA